MTLACMRSSHSEIKSLIACSSLVPGEGMRQQRWAECQNTIIRIPVVSSIFTIGSVEILHLHFKDSLAYYYALAYY